MHTFSSLLSMLAQSIALLHNRNTWQGLQFYNLLAKSDSELHTSFKHSHILHRLEYLIIKTLGCPGGPPDVMSQSIKINKFFVVMWGRLISVGNMASTLRKR